MLIGRFSRSWNLQSSHTSLHLRLIPVFERIFIALRLWLEKAICTSLCCCKLDGWGRWRRTTPSKRDHERGRHADLRRRSPDSLRA